MAIEKYISEEQIAAKVSELADQINKDYAGQEIIVVGVLNGSFMFAADLIRKIKVPVTLDFIGASSYGDKTESSGKLSITLDIVRDLKDTNILLVEDIVDTGLTITELQKYFASRGPKSVKLASLLHKPARSEHDVKIDYLAFEIEDKFVIGYGLDYAGRYRELPYIGIYSDDN